MEIAALVVAVLALLIALSARAKAGGQARAVEDARAELGRRTSNLREELEADAGRLREMLALVADREPLTGEMVREGRLWRDATPKEGEELLASGARIVDVRSPQETAQGVLPGAMLLPIDELEQRYREIPRDGKPTLVYCAGGGRSAAACELLSGEGWTGLHNLAGGISSWAGPVVPQNRTDGS